MRFIVVTLVLALAGCLQGGSDADPTAGPTTQTTTTTTTGPAPQPARDLAMLLAFEYTGCAGYEGIFDVDAAAAQTVLPEGYEVRTFQPSVPALPEVARVQVIWAQCDGFRNPNSVVNDTAFGSVAVAIESLGAETNAWYRLRMLTQDDIMQTLWTTAGYDVHAGTWSNDFSGAVPAGPVAAMRAEPTAGGYSADLLTSLGSSGAAEAVTYHTDVDLGRLEWTGRIQAHSAVAASGTVAFPADDAAAALVQNNGLTGSQRILLDVDFTDNDLWLRVS